MTANADLLFDRTPPHNEDAERAVLGAMLLSAEAVAEVVERLRPEDFYRPVSRATYEAILALYGRGEPVDPTLVLAELTRAGRTLDQVAPFLHSLIERVPVTTNAGYYAGIVADAALGRRVIEAGTRITQLGYADAEGEDLVDRAEAELAGLTKARPEDCVPLGDLLGPTLDEIEAIEKGDGPNGVPTGFVDLDRILHGLHPGQLVIVAARPAVGKSTLATDTVRCASIKHGMTSVIFSLEMSRSEIATRILAAEARVSLTDLRSGTLREGGWARIADATGRIASAPLYVDDSPDLTLTAIRAKARRLKQRHDLRLVIVDYLQLMASPGRAESREQEVGQLSRGLKLLAKELEVPVLAVSQLNRGLEQRQDKRPMLSDLRESGALEQDADVVLMLYREDMYEKESERAGEADIIVAKHRNGPTGTVAVAFQGHYARFADLASDWAAQRTPDERARY